MIPHWMVVSLATLIVFAGAKICVLDRDLKRVRKDIRNLRLKIEWQEISREGMEIAKEILAQPEDFPDDYVRRIIKLLQALRQELPDEDYEATIADLNYLLR